AHHTTAVGSDAGRSLQDPGGEASGARNSPVLGRTTMSVWLRRIGLGLLGLVLILAIAAGAVYAIGTARINDEPQVDAHAFDASAGDVAQGAQLARSL